MKKIFLFLGLVLIFCGCENKLRDENVREKVEVKDIEKNDEQQLSKEQIDSICDNINLSINSYKEEIYKDVDIYDDIFESEVIYRLAMINLKKYYYEDELKKVIVSFGGDREDLISEYYFDDNNLIFVSKDKTDFDNPKWHDDFNEKNKLISKNKYYFDNNKIFYLNFDSNKGLPNKSEENFLYKIKKKIELKINNDVEVYKNYRM